MPEAMFVMAKLVVVPLPRSVFPTSVVLPSVLAKVELKADETVEEPVTASDVEVAPWS